MMVLLFVATRILKLIFCCVHREDLSKPGPRHPIILSESEQGLFNHRNETHRSFRFHETILSFGEPGSLGLVDFPEVWIPSKHFPPVISRDLHPRDLVK